MMMECEELIPGLPRDIALECLIRLPLHAFPKNIHCVSKVWAHHLHSPDFHRLRESAGFSRNIIAFIHSEYEHDQCSYRSLIYRISLFDPVTSFWMLVPSIPGQTRGLPLFCQLATIGHELIVIGGWDPKTWTATRDVHVYDLVAATWRRGAPMPGPLRSFFACAAGAGAVFVAGGHDESKNGLSSALAYDVAADRWSLLPDMAGSRDECHGVFVRGEFRVVGGYPTEAQGHFSRSTESFNVATWRWGPIKADVLEDATCPRMCITGTNDTMYMCRHGQVATVKDDTWHTLVDLPTDVGPILNLVACNDWLMVVGARCHGGRQVGYILDLSTMMWQKVETPAEFSGHVQSGCCLRI